jgi:hypothetical protein
MMALRVLCDEPLWCAECGGIHGLIHRVTCSQAPKGADRNKNLNPTCPDCLGPIEECPMSGVYCGQVRVPNGS